MQIFHYPKRVNLLILLTIPVITVKNENREPKLFKKRAVKFCFAAAGTGVLSYVYDDSKKVQICRGFICKFKELRLLCDLFLATIRLNHGGATRNEKVRGEVLECDDFRMNHHRA